MSNEIYLLLAKQISLANIKTANVGWKLTAGCLLSERELPMQHCLKMEGHTDLTHREFGVQKNYR